MAVRSARIVGVALSLAIRLGSPGTVAAYSACEDVSAAATLVCNAELATVSDDSAVVTWVTNRESSSAVTCKALDGTDCSASSDDPTIYHAMDLTNLKPGQIYFYWIETEPPNPPAAPTQQSPGVFRTFDTDRLCSSSPCEPLFRFASLNDMHVGEGISGQLTDVTPPGGEKQPIPPSFRKDEPPYWKVMNEGAVGEINLHGVAFTIVKGDVTAEGGNPTQDPGGAQFEDAAAILASLGTVHPTRGNHDKSIDLFIAKLLPSLVGLSVNDRRADADPHLDYSFDHTASGKTFHFVALDTWDNDKPIAGPAIGAGRFTDDQLEWLAADLTANAGKKTFLYMHHPTSEVAAATAVPPVIFGVRQPDAVKFIEIVRAHSDVIGVLSAHTHRNWVTASALAPGVPFVETAATKEYPGGYAIYEVFEHGYVQSFYKCTTPECLEWSEKTRGEYLNLYPLYTSQSGALNGSFAYDFRTREILSTEIE